MAGEIKASPRNRTLGKVADKLTRLKALANKYEVLPQVPLLGGTGIGDLLMGEAPEEVTNWSYGNLPMQVPEMSNIPQMKTGRAQSVADTLFLGADIGALGGLAAKLGAKGLSNVAGSAGRMAAPGAESQLGVIKPKGGNWIGGSIEDTVRSLKKDVLNEEGLKNLRERTGDDNLQSYLTTRAPDYALNSWIDKTLGKYIKNEMATPEDPVRALAERGILHVDPSQLNFNLGTYGDPLLMAPGQKNMGQSQAAKQWEGASDMQVFSGTASDYTGEGKTALGAVSNNPWLTKIDPGASVYDLYEPDNLGRDLGFYHLLDELANATNPDSGLPRELLLKYDALPRVTVPQAVERVAKINEWRAAQKVLADQSRANNPATQVFKEYPDQGYKWVELRMPEKAPEGWTESVPEGSKPNLDPDYAYGSKALQDALKYEGETMGHCVGGYCPDVAAGKSRIYSLRDAKGQPHVTVEVNPPTVSKEGSLSSDELPPEVLQDFKRRGVYSPEFRWRMDEELGRYVPVGGLFEPKITQIRGKGNAAPKADYLPFVQDFVRSGQWSDVGDLENTGLIDVGDERRLFQTLRDKVSKPMLDSEIARALGVYGEQNPNSGRYMTETELLQIIEGKQPPQNFAQGGLVTQYDPARIEALVSQLMDDN